MPWPQRTAGMLGGKVVYMLDARAELTADERTLVSKHGLGKLSIYDSEGRKKRMEARRCRSRSRSTA